ncbi:hypothetical protein NGM37_38840, partial [Streptomyces sp. TRM76130]|nr:hypothetical protein [Streptomyces sp. TRM76130]
TGKGTGKGRATDSDGAPATDTGSTPPPPLSEPFQVRPARGNSVATLTDGRCILYTFIGTDPERVRDRLPGLSAQAPATYAWLGRPDAVRADLARVSAGDTSPATRQARAHLLIAADHLRAAAERRLLDARGGGRPLPP